MVASVVNLVSVIVPVYNRPSQLQVAVESVLAQDYRPIEILIVDDGSTDGLTSAVAHALAAAHPEVVRLLCIANGGPGVARECGRKAARGEFIQYLDSDDVLLPGKFTAQVAALRLQPEANVAYGITLLRDAAGRLAAEPHKDTGVSRAHMFPSFLNSRWWDTATPLYRAAVCKAAGPWSSLRLEEDWEYDCRVAVAGGTLAQCGVPVSETREHEGDRLSRGDVLNSARLVMRAQSHRLVWGHAKQAGLPESAPREVARFARSLFLLARQCGEAGLPNESSDLHALAEEAGKQDSSVRRQLRVYRIVAAILGWQWAGRLGSYFDQFRHAMKVRSVD